MPTPHAPPPHDSYDITDVVCCLTEVVGTVDMLHALVNMLEQVLDEFRHVIGASKHTKEPLPDPAWRPIEVCVFVTASVRRVVEGPCQVCSHCIRPRPQAVLFCIMGMSYIVPIEEPVCMPLVMGHVLELPGHPRLRYRPQLPP